ncbi:MAG: hypothetical protein WCJ30_28815, partial [Deltaproteobacteria bacterium]
VGGARITQSAPRGGRAANQSVGEFDHSAGTVSRLEAAGTIAATIVVGIGHLDNDDPVRSRFADFVPADPAVPADTHRAAQFYRFLHDELAPQLERT